MKMMIKKVELAILQANIVNNSKMSITTISFMIAEKDKEIQ